MTYAVTIDRSWDDAAPRWSRLLAAPLASPFQAARWLSRWYESFFGRVDIEPIIVHVADRNGTDVIGLPLILRHGWLRTIETADLGITDYNAPLLGPAAPVDEAGARALWQAVRAALPPADLIEFSKMMTTIDGRPNPLVLALGGETSSLFGNCVRIDSDWDTWLHSLGRHYRKELARKWRVFTRDERARFVFAENRQQAERIYELMSAQQRERIQSLGLPYLLDEPDYDRFYRELVFDGLDDGSIVLSALTAGDEFVAGLLGVTHDDHFAILRISAASDGRWANCSPGRLVIGRTMEALHGRGVRTFDFTIGDYAHKRTFGVQKIPLVDILDRGSWRGWPRLMWERLKGFVRRRATLERLARKVMRRPA